MAETAVHACFQVLTSGCDHHTVMSAPAAVKGRSMHSTACRCDSAGAVLCVTCVHHCGLCVCRQAVAAAEAYIQQHGLDDVQIEVETRTLDELREVSRAGPSRGAGCVCHPYTS
jgi:hypothetical protein